MPSKKSSSSAVKVIDVADPDTVKSDATSIPIIVSNRAILKDPMIVGSPSDSSKETPKAKAKQGPVIKKIELKPLDDEEKSEPADESAVAAQAKETAPALGTETEKDAENPADTSEAAAEKSEPAPVPLVPDVDKKGEDKATKPEQPAPASEEKPAVPDLAAKPAEGSGDASDALPAGATDVQKSPVDEQNAKAAREAAEKELALEKLIAEGTYILPVNTVEKRRIHRTILVVFLIVLALGIAGFLAALDAGYVHIEGISAPTDFIKQ